TIDGDGSHVFDAPDDSARAKEFASCRPDDLNAILYVKYQRTRSFHGRQPFFLKVGRSSAKDIEISTPTGANLSLLCPTCGTMNSLAETMLGGADRLAKRPGLPAKCANG